MHRRLFRFLPRVLKVPPVVAVSMIVCFSSGAITRAVQAREGTVAQESPSAQLTPPVPTPTPTRPLPTPTPTPAPTPIKAATSVCSTDGIATLLSMRNPTLAWFTMTSRLETCKTALDPKKQHPDLCVITGGPESFVANGPGAARKYPPSPQELASLFNLLEFCVGAAASPSPAPSPPYISHIPTFYVIAPGAAEPLVVDAILRNVVNELHKSVTKFAPPLPKWQHEAPRSPKDTFDDQTLIIGHADWAIKDFAAQCAADPSVQGALVIDGLMDQSATETYIVWQNAWTRLNAEAELISCPHDENGVVSEPELVAVQHGIEGAGYRNGFPFTVASGVASFFASRYGAVADPTKYTSPSVQQVVQGTSTALLLATVGGGLNSIVFPALNTNSQLNHATLDFSRSIMNELNRQCTEAKAYPGDDSSAYDPKAAALNQTITDLKQLCGKMKDFTPSKT